MPVIQRIIKNAESSISKKSKPVVIKWKGVKMLRSQSINACVHEIIEYNKKQNFIKINLIGMSGSGKTTLSEVLAHQIHTMSDVPYDVRFFEDSDLVDFKTTVQSLSRRNQILIFDDLSGLVANHGKAALDKVKAEITTVRHIDGNEDRKIIMIMNFHAQKALDKFLRIANFTFYSSCQLEEIGYLEELLGKIHKPKILSFSKLRINAGIYHKFAYPLSRGNSFTYKEADPFLPYLYSNGLTTRNVVSPTLEWILGDDLCPICKNGKSYEDKKINLEEFVADITKKFGKGVAKRAIELKLMQMGIETQPKRVLQAQKYLSLAFTKKTVDIKDLAEAFNLKHTKTRLTADKLPEISE